MNENIDLTKILKDCPKGWKFYSSIYGDVTFLGIENGSEYPVKFSFINKNNSEKYSRVTEQGLHVRYSNGECSLFPSKDQRDWSKFTAPWYKLEKQGNLSQTNEREWLYLVSDVLTWKDGIGQYLDDIRVQELAKRLCSEYVQKLYNPSNTGKNEQKSADKIEPKFKVGDCVVDNCGYVWKIEGRLNQFYILEGVEGGESRPTIDWVDKTFHLWTIQDAKDGDVLALSWLEDKNLWAKIVIFKKYHSKGVKELYYNMPCVEGYGITFKNGKTVFNEQIPYYSKTWTCNLHPATKEQRDLLFQKMKKAGYKWNAETNTFEKF